MDVFEAITKRYSCRNYLDKPIEPEKFEKVLDAARQAPSAKNLQDWRFVIVTDPVIKTKIAHAAKHQMFLTAAPAIIVACTTIDYKMTCNQPAGSIDVAIALEHIALEAVELGLATCWVGAFHDDEVKTILDIPESVAVVELMPIGYSADSDHRATPRRELSEITCYNSWQF